MMKVKQYKMIGERRIMKSPSFLERMAEPTKKGSELVMFVCTSVSYVLRSSVGRDKLLGCAQYSSDLYKACMLDYLTTHRIREWPTYVRNAKIIADSMKNGRKIFRLMRSFEELDNFIKKLRKPLDLVLVLKQMRHLTAAVYYLLDNLVWIAQIGVISKFISFINVKLESTKNAASLFRYILLVIITLLSFIKRQKKQKDLTKSLKRMPNSVVTPGSISYKNTLSLLKARTKLRYQVLDVTKNFLRILMLIESLEIPGSSRLSPIFISLCGLVSSTLAIFKLLSLKTGHSKPKSDINNQTSKYY